MDAGQGQWRDAGTGTLSRIRLVVLALVMAAGLAACAAPPLARPAAVAPAQVTVRGRVLLPAGAAALPPGALLRVQLLDTSLADAPATVLAEQYTGLGGERTLPHAFELCTDADKVSKHARYQVSARITDRDGRLLMLTTDAYPVLTQGAPAHADLTVRPVGH